MQAWKVHELAFMTSLDFFRQARRLTKCFPNLTKAQAYECLAYYEDHRDEIDLLIAREMAQASE